jgi:hypothetical protein
VGDVYFRDQKNLILFRALGRAPFRWLRAPIPSSAAALRASMAPSKGTEDKDNPSPSLDFGVYIYIIPLPFFP